MIAWNTPFMVSALWAMALSAGSGDRWTAIPHKSTMSNSVSAS